MILIEKSLRISDGCVKFSLISQAGNCCQPVTMGRGAARNLAESILELLHLEQRAAMNPAALDRLYADLGLDPVGLMLESVQDEPDLVRRETRCMEAIHGASDGEMDTDSQ